MWNDHLYRYNDTLQDWTEKVSHAVENLYLDTLYCIVEYTAGRYQFASNTSKFVRKLFSSLSLLLSKPFDVDNVTICHITRGHVGPSVVNLLHRNDLVVRDNTLFSA